ncbi:MAG: peptide-methionine (S)-S-oxide reductase, partial [Candidatus Nanohaloarchaea archaeon]
MTESIVLGGGCFWCVEAAFKELDGVTDTTVGYAGGETDDPTYREVCTGETGHAEVVKVEFEPEEVSLKEV